MSETKVEYTNKVLVELKNEYRYEKEIYVFYLSKKTFRIFNSRESFESFIDMLDLSKLKWYAKVMKV